MKKAIQLYKYQSLVQLHFQLVKSYLHLLKHRKIVQKIFRKYIPSNISLELLKDYQFYSFDDLLAQLPNKLIPSLQINIQESEIWTLQPFQLASIKELHMRIELNEMDEEFFGLFQYLNKLEYLSLHLNLKDKISSNKEQYQEIWLEQSFKNLKNVKELKIVFEEIPNHLLYSIFMQIPHLPKLEHLSLQLSKYQKFSSLLPQKNYQTKFLKLKSLNISFHMQNRDDWIKDLGQILHNIPNLEKLKIKFPKMDDFNKVFQNFFLSVIKQEKLQKLGLNLDNISPYNQNLITNHIGIHICQIKNLKSFHLYMNDGCEQKMINLTQNFEKLQNLTKLKISIYDTFPQSYNYSDFLGLQIGKLSNLRQFCYSESSFRSKEGGQHKIQFLTQSFQKLQKLEKVKFVFKSIAISQQQIQEFFSSISVLNCSLTSLSFYILNKEKYDMGEETQQKITNEIGTFEKIQNLFVLINQSIKINKEFPFKTKQIQ